MPILEEDAVGDTEAYIMECVKFLSHLGMVSKTFKRDLKAVFSGRLGVALWTEAIITAAEAEEGREPERIHHLRGEIKVIWDAARAFKDMPIAVVIRGCEGFTTDGRKAVREALFAQSIPPFRFSRTPFVVHLRRATDANVPATRLRLSSKFDGYLHNSNILVDDPPILLAHIAYNLSIKHETTLQRCIVEQREQIISVQRNTDYGTRRAESIRGANDHAFHTSTDYEALVILFHLYRLMRPHLRGRNMASWTQGPFGFNQGKAEINRALDDSVRIEIHEWMVRVQDELQRILGSFRGLEEGQRLHEPTYAENLEAVRYFTSFFTRDEAEKKPFSRLSEVRYPSYPQKPHEVATRPTSLSSNDIASLLQ